MRRFSLKTWNCFGAVQDAKSFLISKEPADPHRFTSEALRRAVEGIDIVCMQELFVRRAEAFFDGLTHDHKVRDTNSSTLWPLTFGGSGLGIASRFPIVDRALVSFSRPSVSAERFARKGLLHARVQVGDDEPLEVDVVTTHMQSGYDAKARAVRARQVRELRDLVDRVGAPDRPVVVCGDMNIDGSTGTRGEGEYRVLAEALHDFVDVGADDDRATFHPHPDVNPLAHRFEPGPRQRIDYVFYRAPRGVGMEVLASAVRFEDALPDSGRLGTFASDHFALEVVFGVGA